MRWYILITVSLFCITVYGQSTSKATVAATTATTQKTVQTVSTTGATNSPSVTTPGTTQATKPPTTAAPPKDRSQLCIACLDEGKKYYKEFLPELKDAREAASKNPTASNCEYLYKLHKRLLIGAVILLNTNKQYQKEVANGKILANQQTLLRKIFELDTFYYDHIFGHEPNKRTKKLLIEFYKGLDSTEENGGYLKQLRIILKKDYPIKSGTTTLSLGVLAFVLPFINFIWLKV